MAGTEKVMIVRALEFIDAIGSNLAEVEKPLKAIREALEDGEALAYLGATDEDQELIELAHDLITNRLKRGLVTLGQVSKRNETLVKVREYIRNPVAWPGGYPVVLYMADGECLCSKCAKENYRLISQATRDNLRDGWQAAGTAIHWEGEPLVCAHCSTEIESAYGIPGDE